MNLQNYLAKMRSKNFEIKIPSKKFGSLPVDNRLEFIMGSTIQVIGGAYFAAPALKHFAVAAAELTTGHAKNAAENGFAFTCFLFAASIFYVGGATWRALNSEICSRTPANLSPNNMNFKQRLAFYCKRPHFILSR